MKNKITSLKHLFGTLKSNMTGQEFKDMVREGWESEDDKTRLRKLKKKLK